MRAQQQDLFQQLQTPSEKREYKRRTTHGGMAAKGKRKLRRPLATKQWIHLVLKSDKAKGKYSLLRERNAKWIDQLIRTKAKKFEIELKEFVNMGNHIHCQIRIRSRQSFQSFLRSITTLIARYVTGARRGLPFGKFWQGLAFTRVVKTYLEVTVLEHYLVANTIERRNGYRARERYLASVSRRIKHLLKSIATI